MKYSYSAISKYQECPFKYKLHYVDRLRQKYQSSPLIFGSAMDMAVQAMLDNWGKETDFITLFSTKFQELCEGNEVKFSKTDCDLSLIDEHIFIELQKHFKMDLKTVASSGLNYKDEIEAFSQLCFESLKTKGIMLLNHFYAWAKDNVQEVQGTQNKVEFANEEGDVFEGYLDFVCTLKDGRKVVMDLKTSSNPNKYYPEDSANNSPQLTIYSHFLENADVGYIVLDKTVRKKEPRIRHKEVYGTITDDQVNKVFNDIDETLHKIRDKVFPQNFNSCNNFNGCEYRNYCKSNGENMEGLCYKTTQEVKRD